MKVSYSRLDCFNTCPYLYKLKYIEHLEPKDDLSPSNALYLGTAVHEAIEHRDVEAGVESYKSHFNELTQENELEIYKLRTILPKAIEAIPHGEYEYKLEIPDEFIGYIDCLVPVDENTYDILDFKHSNNISGYKKSGQIHLYKYYFERITGKKIRDLYYVFIPKSTLKLNEDINIVQENIDKELSDKPIKFEKIDFDNHQINLFFAKKSLLERTTVFEKRYSVKCNWCDFKNFCKSNGADRSELKNETSL